MDVKITINCDNAAFEGSTKCEIRRILKDLVDNKLSRYGVLKDGAYFSLIDVNGNKVGEFNVTD